MKIVFNDNAYFLGMTQEWNFKNKKSILLHTTRNLEFRYGRVTYQKFSQNYRSALWLKRKIIALPYAFWAIFIQSTYHLAKAILALSKENRSSKKYVYAVARDFQEAFGRILSIFHDKYGLYHIQESEFQKLCYACYRVNAFDSLAFSVSEEVDLPPKPKKASKTPPPPPAAASPTLASSSLPPLLSASLIPVNSMSGATLSVQNVPVNPKEAEEHLKNGKLAEAYALIKKITDEQIQAHLYVELSEKFFDKGQIDKAVEVAERIWTDKKLKANLILKFAEKEFERKNYDSAFQITKKIIYYSPVKDLYSNLTKHYLNTDQKEKALEVVHDYTFVGKGREDLYIEIAIKYNADLDFIKDMIFNFFKVRVVTLFLAEATRAQILSKVASKLKECSNSVAQKLADSSCPESIEYIKKGDKDKTLEHLTHVYNARGDILQPVHDIMTSS